MYTYSTGVIITQGKSESFEVEIKNLGKQVSNLGFSLEEGPEDWVKLPGSISSLERGETRTEEVEIEVPEDAEPGDYPIELEISHSEGSGSFDLSLTIREKVPTCPECPEPSDWSECKNGSQARTNYICNAGTDYECKAVNETRSCEVKVEECPDCPPPEDWSRCMGGSQERVNYRCGPGTDYSCEAYTEDQNCSLCGNNYCEEGENSDNCPEDCPRTVTQEAGGITGRIIGSTAGRGAIVALVLILVGIIGVYWFKKNLR